MIRAATPADTNALMALAAATGMFTPDELEALAGMLDDGLAGRLGEDHVWLVDEDDGLQGAAYYAPEVMAHDVWNLLFIGVHEAQRRRGRGEALLRHVERSLRERGARLLLVETSGLEAFEPARRFYRKNGFDEEARIREFYRAGEDKIVFRKALNEG